MFGLDNLLFGAAQRIFVNMRNTLTDESDRREGYS
jgi:hypothetical protein